MPVIPLPTGNDADTAVDNTNARLINAYAVKSPEGARSPFYIQGSAGLVEWADVGTGPIRADEIWQDNLYVASGTRIFKIDDDITTTEWGVISNGGRMPMAAGFDFILTAGESGELFLIDDDGVENVNVPFPVQDLRYFQGQFTFLRKDAPNAGEYFVNKITPDAGEKISFDPLDFANAETESDAAIAVERKGDLLWIMGDKTTETFVFGSGIPYTPISGVFFDVGCAARDTVTKSTNNVYWLGSDLTIRENGVKVSSLDVEKAIANSTLIDQSYGYAFKEYGNEFVAFTFGLSSTWVFDIVNRKWHERKTYQRDYWQPTTAIRFADKQLMGDSLTGKIFSLDPAVFDYDGNFRVCVVQMPYVHADGDNIKMGPLELTLNGGAGTSTILDPQIMIEYSRDGGRTFSSEIWRSMGARGVYREPVRVNRLGRNEDIIFRLTVSDAVEFQLIKAWLGAKLGRRT